MVGVFFAPLSLVCLHFGFRPSWRVFLYTYHLHAPHLGKGFMSFRAQQGRKLFDSFEESIQEFKWHYFKILPLPGKRPFWLDDEDTPFPWVYWNSDVGDYHITALDPLGTLAFEFLQSLPAGLGKKSNFKCRWISDHNDAEVGKMKEAEGAGPRSILPSSMAQTAASGSSASVPAAPVGIENAFAAKIGLEKELAATKDQVDVLTAERDSALATPILKAKIDSLTEELRLAEGGRLSALAHMKEVEEGTKVQAAELESCHSALEQEKKKVESFTQSLEQKQTALDEAEAAAGHWREEWKALAEETRKMVQESFDILMDQVRHLNSAIDYSMITLNTRWDPKAKRIYNPKAEAQEQSEPMVEDQPEPVAEGQPEVLADGGSEPLVEQQQVEETVGGEVRCGAIELGASAFSVCPLGYFRAAFQ
ncbi:hypothetical protein PIB30_065562 [Stylosanthes scabra]|uniref:Uncharacterized protein n=1 Tax=Stylosanthes scabra TaxID=79078 RepID=A0ABU6ZKR6_9FABA|nr:hypothetical protein [Stylosanthes scabra]